MPNERRARCSARSAFLMIVIKAGSRQSVPKRCANRAGRSHIDEFAGYAHVLGVPRLATRSLLTAASSRRAMGAGVVLDQLADGHRDRVAEDVYDEIANDGRLEVAETKASTVCAIGGRATGYSVGLWVTSSCNWRSRVMR